MLNVQDSKKADDSVAKPKAKDSSSSSSDDSNSSYSNHSEDSEESSSSSSSEETTSEKATEPTSGEDPEVGSDSPPEESPLLRNVVIPEVVLIKDEDVVEIPTPVIRPTHTLWVNSSVEEDPKANKSPSKKKKKVRMNPKPSAGFLSYPDGSMAAMPADMLERIASASQEYNNSTAGALAGFGGTGSSDARVPKTSGGSLEAPLAVSSPLVSSNSSSQDTESQPSPGPSLESHRRAHQDKGTSPGSSEGTRTSGSRGSLVVDPQGGLGVRLLTIGQR